MIIILFLTFLSCSLIKFNEAFRLGILNKPPKTYGFLPPSEYLSSCRAISSFRLQLNVQEIVHTIINAPSTRKRVLLAISLKAASIAIATYLLWKVISKGYSKTYNSIEPVSSKLKRAKNTKTTLIPDSALFEIESSTDTRKVFSYFNETYIRPGNQKDVIGLSKNSKLSINEDVNEKKVTFEQMLQRAKTKLKISWTPHTMIQNPQPSNITVTALLTPVPIKINGSSQIPIAADDVMSAESATEEGVDNSSEEQPPEVDSIIDAVVVTDMRQEPEENPVVTPEILSPDIEIPDVIEVVEVVRVTAVEVPVTTTPSFEAEYSEVEEDTEAISSHEPEGIVHTTELMSLATSKRLKEAEILEDIGAASALLTGLIISCFLGPKVGIALVATSGLLKKKADTDISGGSKTVMQLFGRAIFESAKLLLSALNGGSGGSGTVTTATDPAGPAEEGTGAKYSGHEWTETDTHHVFRDENNQ